MTHCLRALTLPSTRVFFLLVRQFLALPSVHPHEAKHIGRFRHPKPELLAKTGQLVPHRLRLLLSKPNLVAIRIDSKHAKSASSTQNLSIGLRPLDRFQYVIFGEPVASPVVYLPPWLHFFSDGKYMEILDKQMTQWASRLRDDLKIEPADANQIATSITRDVSNIPEDVVREIHANALVPIQVRLDELTGFQDFMDTIHAGAVPRPSFVRAQVVYQNYISFMYLGDACFNILRKNLAAGCTAKKCMKFLTDNPIRAFRNAMAHANWSYLDDFSGLQYWARKGAADDEPMVRFEVTQIEFDFWASLARCVGYSSLLTLSERERAE